MKIIDGKAVSDQIKKEIKDEVNQIKSSGGKIPHLAAVLVGHDGGSEQSKSMRTSGFQFYTYSI